ncbi:MAG: heme-binding protein [Candidatus Thiodiazotropha sp. 6PLUC9]
MLFDIRSILLATTFTLTQYAYADSDALYPYRSLSLETAYKATEGAVKECRKRGYSVAVAVVDRGGNLTAFLRDRFAGPHTTQTAIQKAWTANSFRQSTSVVAALLEEGRIPNQVQNNPGARLLTRRLSMSSSGFQACP